MISYADRALVPSHVLIRFLGEQSVLVNLNTQRYFALDADGTRMWQLVTAASSIEDAYLQLLDEFEKNPQILRLNLSQLLQHLLENGLIAAEPTDARRYAAV